MQRSMISAISNNEKASNEDVMTVAKLKISPCSNSLTSRTTGPGPGPTTFDDNPCDDKTWVHLFQVIY